MVALKSERRAFLWQIAPQPRPAEAAEKVEVTMEEIVCLLEGEWSGKRARVYLSAGGRILEDDDPDADPKNQIYIADIRRNLAAGTATILINRGDPNTVSPAFIHTEAASVRVEEPTAKETPGWSAHLVLSLTNVDGRHRACFEQMPRLSSSLVEKALNEILARSVIKNPTYQFETITKQKGKPKINHRPYRPFLSAIRVPSENLLDDLEQGQLAGVTLTRRRTYYAGVGEKDIVKFQEEKIVLHTRPADRNATVAFLEDVLKKARADEYEKVSFHLDKLPGNATNHPTLDLANEDAMEQLYVRAQRLHQFKNVLQQCYPSICDDIDEKMVDIVNNKNLW